MNPLSPLLDGDLRLIPHEPLGLILSRATPTHSIHALFYASLRCAQPACARLCFAVLRLTTLRDDLATLRAPRHAPRPVRTPRITCAARSKSP